MYSRIKTKKEKKTETKTKTATSTMTTRMTMTINQSKIYLVTSEALQGDSKVAWAILKVPPKTHKK